MASNPIVTNLIKQIRTEIYGKDVREAIARAIEITYESADGDIAMDAAERANEAADRVVSILDASQENLEALEKGIAELDDVVVINDEQPTSQYNKIWIQPQGNAEYKIATYAAYEALWNRFNEIATTYQQGHGGVVSIIEDTTYHDDSDELKRRYVITYSDGTTEEFFVNNGERGEVGPVDKIIDTQIKYVKGIVKDGKLDGVPPTDGWVTDVPNLNPGDYLWTQTIVTYESEAQAYIYGVSRMGLNGRDGIDGSGAVNSVAIGTSGTPMTGDIKLPVDSTPTANSGNLMTSGGINTALDNMLVSPAFTGTPTAPTANTSDSSQQIATTEFVKNAIADGAVDVDTKVRVLEVTMSSQTLTLEDSGITENTVCKICGTDLPVRWTTSNGSVYFELLRTISSPETFYVVLFETTGVE